MQLVIPLRYQSAKMTLQIHAIGIRHPDSIADRIACLNGLHSLRIYGSAAALVAKGIVLNHIFARNTLAQSFGHARCICPSTHHLIQQPPLLRTGRRTLKLFQQASQRIRLHRCLLQLTHIARATHIGQRFQGFWHLNLLGKLGIKSIRGQLKLTHSCCTAVSSGKTAFPSELIAIRQILVF